MSNSVELSILSKHKVLYFDVVEDHKQGDRLIIIDGSVYDPNEPPTDDNKCDNKQTDNIDSTSDASSEDGNEDDSEDDSEDEEDLDDYYTLF